MNFDDILDASIELLRKRQRITYRTLKRQFSLDEEGLEDLKHELITGQRVAVDEGGEVLVWKEGAQHVPKAPLARPSAPALVKAEEPSVQPLAERRQLTVLFCDLVGSTALSGTLDPEDLRNLVSTYQAASDTAIQRFDGYVAQYLGDGILAYFGYPRTHEDEAERAIRAALEVVDSMEQVSLSTERSHGSRLAVRIGIHTGTVVVGQMGTGAGRQQLALGEAPNVAARVQGLAEPGSILISDVTYQMVRGQFETVDLGPHTLKGVAEPMRVHRVRAERQGLGFEEGHLREMVGRSVELSALRAAWESVTQGEFRAVLLSGEAGIGKSRLARAVVDDLVCGRPHLLLRCSAYHHSTAFFPISEYLERRLRFQREDEPARKLQLLENYLRELELSPERAVPLLAPLLGLPLPGRQASPELSPQRQKQALLEFLAQWLARSAQGPAAIIIEDLHWADASTLELLSLMFTRGGGLSRLFVMTARTEFRPPWPHVPGFNELRLSRFGLSEVAAIVSQSTGGKCFAPTVLRLIASKTDGVPLFVQEVAKLLLEKGRLHEVNGSYEPVGPLDGLTVPTTLHDSLMARLDQLNTARDVAQLSAVIGREFSYELLRSVWSRDEKLLEHSLHQLVSAELVYEYALPRRFVFKHALIQEVAYQSLLRATRQSFHAAIADALERNFEEEVLRQPELVAHHLSGAGLHARAIVYWQRAGERAAAQSAHEESIHLLQQALEATHTLPDSPERARQELAIQIALGVPLTATRGYGAPEVRQAYARAQELCQLIGDPTQHFAALYGLWRSCLLRAEYGSGVEMSEQLMRLSGEHQGPTLVLTAHRSAGSILFYMGEHKRTALHLQQVLRQEVAVQQERAEFAGFEVVDLLSTAHAYSAWNEWMMGNPREALAQSEASLRASRNIGHAFSRALSLSFAAWFHQFRRDTVRVRACAMEAMAISKELGLQMWIGWNRVLEGWAMLSEGRAEEARRTMRQGIREWLATGSRLGVSYFLTMVAEAEAASGQVEAGLEALDEAQQFVDSTGERFWLPELLRHRALLLERSGAPAAQVLQTLREARGEASRSSACMLELRVLRELHSRQQGAAREEVRSAVLALLNQLGEGAEGQEVSEARDLLAVA